MFRILRSWRAVNLYIDALARFGIDSNSYDAELASRICRDVCDELKPSDSVDWAIGRAAALVALCILGPSEYGQFKGDRHEVTVETVEAAAKAFSRGGDAAASLDLKIIFAVANFGALHRSFAVMFCKALASQN